MTRSRITAMFGTGCRTCDYTGHVCSDDGTGDCPPGHHGSTVHPWDGLSGRSDACDHGGGAPCPRCSPERCESCGSLVTTRKTMSLGFVEGGGSELFATPMRRAWWELDEPNGTPGAEHTPQRCREARSAP